MGDRMGSSPIDRTNKKATPRVLFFLLSIAQGLEAALRNCSGGAISAAGMEPGRHAQCEAQAGRANGSNQVPSAAPIKKQHQGCCFFIVYSAGT